MVAKSIFKLLTYQVGHHNILQQVCTAWCLDVAPCLQLAIPFFFLKVVFSQMNAKPSHVASEFIILHKHTKMYFSETALMVNSVSILSVLDEAVNCSSAPRHVCV